MAEDYSQDQIDSWIDSKELRAWQLAIYMAKFKANFGSYQLHFRAAIRHVNPSHISRARMEYVAEKTILARIRGEVPTDGVSTKLCKDYANSNLQWY